MPINIKRKDHKVAVDLSDKDTPKKKDLVAPGGKPDLAELKRSMAWPKLREYLTDYLAGKLSLSKMERRLKGYCSVHPHAPESKQAYALKDFLKDTDYIESII